MIPTTQLPLVVPEVAISTSHGFKTISLGILKETPVDLGEGVPARALTFAGHYDGEVVECALIMQDSWEVDEPDGMRPISLWWSAVAFRRLSVGSDRMIRMLEKVFDLPTSGRRMRESVPVKVVSFGTDPATFRSKKLPLKAFFGEADGVEASELYVNIDLPNHRIELSEKDPEYRTGVVTALSDSMP